MKTLYESILDQDDQIVHDTVEKASELGRIINLMVECFYKKEAWASNSLRVLISPEKLNKDGLFGINYTIYDKYHEDFRRKLKELGFKIIPRYTEDNRKQFSVKLKGLKGHTVVIDFKAFSDYTFVNVTANDSDKKAILDLFNKYTAQRK